MYIYGSQEYGGSMTLTTIDRSAPTVTFSTSNVTANGFKISATSSATADVWQYSTNGGSSWTQFSTTASTSASVTITSLSPNTSYTVRVRARRQYNHVYGTSGSSTVKTLGGAVVNSVNTVTADNATVSITINVTVYEASYTNSLVLKNGSTTILTISGLSWSKGTANRTVTLTSAQRTTLLNAMASIKSLTGTFAVSSYSGSTQIGSTSSKTATVLTTATNSAPTISGFTYADSYTTTKNLTGNDQLFVQDYSTLKVTPGTATAKNGASISNYTASCNGLSASNSTGAAITVGKITKSGSVTVTLSVTDSRGYTAETSQTVTVIPYTKPKISSITLRRTNDIEAEMQLKFSGSISAVTVDGTQKNSVVYVRYRYKKTSESSYGSYTSIYSGTTKSGTSFSYSNLELCNLDANSSYDFHLQIQDKLYTPHKQASNERYPFTGKLFCGVCGKPYCYYHYTTTNKQPLAAYRCMSRKTQSAVEVSGQTYTPPHKATFNLNASPELIAYRERHCKPPKERPMLCTDVRISIDLPQKAFCRAWNLIVAKKLRYQATLRSTVDNAEDILVRYRAEEMCLLIDEIGKINEFSYPLMLKTLDRVVVNTNGKLSFIFQSGIKITV